MCVCPVFQRAENTAVPCVETDIRSKLLKIKPPEYTHLSDISMMFLRNKFAFSSSGFVTVGYF